MKKLMMAAAISAASLLASGAQAVVIYDGGGPNQNDALFAETSFVDAEVAESFTLAAGANTIGDVHWWGVCGQGTCPTGNFAVNFYNNNSGAPGAQIASYAVGNANQTATGNFVVGGYAEYAYSTNIAALALTPGTTYWMGISNSTGLGVNGWAWETTSNGNGDGSAQFQTGTGWIINPIEDVAFNLTGRVAAVPEPASLALLGTSLFGMAALWRRKRAC